jgi:hypothetical protein
VPKSRKRAEILTAASRYRDGTSFAMTRQEWAEMVEMMGVENMGGPAVNFPKSLPTPTVPRGSTMAEVMKGMGHGPAAPTSAEPETKPVEKPEPKAAPPAGHVHTPGMRMP